MSEQLLSENSYREYYSEHNFTHVWFRSYLSAHSLILHSVYLIFSIAIGALVRYKYPFSFRVYVGTFSDAMLTYSSTIIGFLLVSFSILLSISSVRNNFSYFVKTNHFYKKPLLKVILDHFIFPIGVFLIILIMSLIIKLLNEFSIISNIALIYKNALFRVFISTYIFLLLLSVSELVSYFFNMYRFIVITSFTISKEYEEDILRKLYISKERIDVLNLDDAKMISDYQEKMKKEKS